MPALLLQLRLAEEGVCLGQALDPGLDARAQVLLCKKATRAFIFFYALALHVLVFYTLYRTTHHPPAADVGVAVRNL